MRKLIATTMLSLDGVLQAPGGPEEDPAVAPSRSAAGRSTTGTTPRAAT